MGKNIILMLLLLQIFCFASGNEKQKDNVWGETKRPPRENFQPQSSQISFDLSKSILINPNFVSPASPKDRSPEKLPPGWYGSLRSWKNVYKAPDIYSKLVRIEEDKNVLFQGKPSVKLSIGQSEKEVYLELYQEISMSKTDLRGKKLKLSFYAYREKEPTSKEFFITGIQFCGGQVIGTTLDIHPKIPVGQWTYFSQEGVIDTKTEIFKFSIRFVSGGNDTVWLSGFLLEVI